MILSPVTILISLILSLPLLCYFLPQSPISQISPADELSDLKLFRSATLHRPKYRLSLSNPNPKIAFLFLTNAPLHFSPLWEKFFQNDKNSHFFNIYLHSDPQVPSPGGVFDGKFIPSKKTSRGTPTLISAARRLIAHALLDDPLNYYFTLLSQSCIPLHSFDYTYKSLFSKKIGKNLFFLNGLSYIEILADEPTLWDRYNARGENVMLPEVDFRDFRVGSQFFTLTRKHAIMVVKDRKLWNKFKMPCLDVDTCYAEEHYFPTLLNMKDPNGCSKYTLTRVNWTDSVGGHPRMYEPEEINAGLIKELRVSNSNYSYLFARKFSEECLGPLMDLADRVIFRK